MNKIVASVGLVALGASAIETSAQTLATPDNSKPWSIAATVRGFYDDNVSTISRDVPGSITREVWGFEISPSIMAGWTWPTTTITAAYSFSYKQYDHTPEGSSERYDMTHTFNFNLDHRFSERLAASVSDSFVIGQEPDLLRAGNTFSSFQRISGNNIRNFGSAMLTGEITRELGFNIGYNNTYFDYSDEGGDAVLPSLSGLLDRMEHSVPIEGTWLLQPETKLVLGYRFREIDYIGDEEIAVGVRSNARNSRSHTGYLGVDHSFRPDLTLSVRGGAQVTDYFEIDSADNEVTPYAQVSLRYNYTPDSFAEVGFTYDRSATDVFQGGTLDAASAVVYGSITHRITPKIYGSLLAQYQNSTYNGGFADDQTEQFFMAGVNFEYRFNQNLSANLGYNYDHLESEIAFRDFSRNRVYLGFTARY